MREASGNFKWDSKGSLKQDYLRLLKLLRDAEYITNEQEVDSTIGEAEKKGDHELRKNTIGLVILDVVVIVAAVKLVWSL